MGYSHTGYVGCSNAFNEEPLEKDNLWYVNMDGRAVFKFATKLSQRA